LPDLEASLHDRVVSVLESHKNRELLTTTGTRSAVDELVSRTRGLEQALHEIAAEVERLRVALAQAESR
jgi:hypothetical protein